MSTAVEHVSDRALPGLSIALDRDALFGILSERLPECRDGMRFVDGRVVDVQYAPGAGAQVLWKLGVHDPETQRTGRQLVTVKVLRDGEAAGPEPLELVKRYRERREEKGAVREMPLRTPWLHIPGEHLLVLAFPLDPVLPTLLEVTDPRTMKEALHRAWTPRRARVRRVRVKTLSYTPEGRAALRYEVLAEDKDTGLPEIRHLVGKLQVRRAPARLFAGHWAIWRRSLGRASVAPPVGYISLSQLSLQEFVSGARLSDLAGRGSFVGFLNETARAIAHVHSLRLPLLARRGVEREMRVVDRWIGVLSRLRPAHAARLEDLGRRLRREVAGRMRITGTVHADFHLANVLADSHGVTLIDWDQAAHSDPMVDVGRVLASLRVSSLRVHGTLTGFADMEDSFLRAYLARTGGDERRARLFEAVSLLIAAAGPFRLQREGWEEGAELMLDEVERVLELSLGGPRAAGPQEGRDRRIPFEERAEWALDRTYAQAVLVPIVHDAFGPDIEVTECLPNVQERGGARLHVRWTVKGYQAGGSRWRGALEGVGFPDHSGRGPLHRLQAAAEVIAERPTAFQLPRPLGHIEPLAMVAFVPPAGRPLVELLGTEGEAEALQQVARALARFHELEIDLAKECETRRHLRSVARRVERLAEARHPAAPAARALFERLEPVLEALGERRAPTPKRLHLRHVRVTSAGAGAALLDDVIWAEPLLVVGDLLAQLHSRALARGIPPSAAERLARAYAEASDRSARELAAFTALSLLRRACRRGVESPDDPRVAPLVETARELLEGSPCGS